MDEEWEKLLRKCGEPSEADWQAHLQANGCLLTVAAMDWS